MLDAGALARFGRVEVEPGSAGYEILTRTGNVEQPVRGWTDWQPLKDGAVASPAGRFLQWKAVLHANGALGSVGVNYLPVNAAPVVDELVVVPGARLNPQSQMQNQPADGQHRFPSPNQNAASRSTPARDHAVAGREGPHRDHRALGGARRRRRRPDLLRSICAETAKPSGGCSRTRSPTRPTASTPR